MNRIQKMALWVLLWISSAVVVSVIAVAVLYFKVGTPKAMAGLGFMGIAGFAGLGPLIFKKDPGKVTCDERDELINSRAAVAGFASAFLVIGIACMLPFTILGPQATISIIWLPMIFIMAGLASFLIHSIAILSQYGWRNKNE